MNNQNIISWTLAYEKYKEQKLYKLREHARGSGNDFVITEKLLEKFGFSVNPEPNKEMNEKVRN